eukprot:TRINITY_DN2047_c0_g2_i3.p1 TRINITY_DN2047_c0_g2~~TRINITY_DN2047_c0_g2_i3.p1  ORF type:complete len:374 (+),score=8.53 TRINITY_DN2047_c0_g2_i3:78-1199(+)
MCIRDRSGTVFSWNWYIHVIIYMIARNAILPYDIANKVEKCITHKDLDRNGCKIALKFFKRKTIGILKERQAALHFIDKLIDVNYLVNLARMQLKGLASSDKSWKSRLKKYGKEPGIPNKLIIAAVPDDAYECGIETISHFYNQPYSKDNNIDKKTYFKILNDGKNVVKEYQKAKSMLSKMTKGSQFIDPKLYMDTKLSSYMLACMIHFMGDMHQPLHMFTRVLPHLEEGKHDLGGSLISTPLVKLGQETSKFPEYDSLHQFWDSAGRSFSVEETLDDKLIEKLQGYAKDLVEKYKPAMPIYSYEIPVDGSYERFMVQDIAKIVYSKPISKGVFALDEDYIEGTREFSKSQIVLAGFRLARDFAEMYLESFKI